MTESDPKESAPDNSGNRTTNSRGSAPSDLEPRVVQLEIQLAHTMRLYEQLNEVVTEQSGVMDRQTRVIRKLREQVKELKDNPGPGQDFDPVDEKPPHY